MSNAIERFKNRQVIPMLLDVPWPIDNPVLEFRVHRFAEVEHTAAMFAADRLLAVERGIPKGSPEYSEELLGAYYYALAEHVQRHIKGWKWLNLSEDQKEPLPFNAANMKGVFDAMTFKERLALGFAYFAIAKSSEDPEENKKKEMRANTQSASPTASEESSSTT